MKKYMIRCDIEGVSGVVSYEQADPTLGEFAFGQRMFMNDLLALVEGLNEGGADEIVIYDEHFYGRNIDIDRLPENVTAICGKPPYRADWAGGLDDSFAGVILLGFHSRRGTGELLHHSYEPDIRNLILCGTPVGEIGIEAGVAGDWGVPLVMITADSAGVAEAEELVPGVVGVSVKESVTGDGGVCLSGKRSASLIRGAARQLVQSPPPAKPWKLAKPELTVEFNPGPYLEIFTKLYGKRMTKTDAVTLRGETVTAIWAEYWQMKLATQNEMKKA